MKTTPSFACAALLVAILVSGCKPAAGPSDAANPPLADSEAAADPSADTAGAPAVAEETRIFNYQCGEYPLTATFVGPDKVSIAFDGRTLQLAQAPSASGVRYVDEKGVEFWTKGLSDATLTLPGRDSLICRSGGMTG